MDEHSSMHQIMQAFAGLGIHELQYKGKDFELMLRKNPESYAANSNVIPSAQVKPADLPVAPSLKNTSAMLSVPEEDSDVLIMESPLVGTFYNSPAPGKPAFVEIGSKVKKGDVLAIIEAMKVMNTIEAECSGTVEKVIPTSGAIVEFGSPIIHIRRD